ncbi:uncharacterized protein LOC110625651 [Manihot esculenta]|uniref:uncharacterized protein LOC110625651 n=1 Tax=Manihot esculenta TaxID=3983 RepID=UPI000B5D20F3|nr:uncharacterized protein LOC110625651 [Manihot esculenta]
MVRELIENDEVESYATEPTRRSESEELERGYRLEKRPRKEEADVDQKLKRLKEQLLTELGARDNGNPREHILNYKMFMELQTHLDALMCKVFPTTLTGPAQAWFNSLEARSIKGFTDLANIFINRFITGVPAERKTSYLETVQQRRNKSLREYVARFNLEALQIPELDEARAMEAMQKGTTSPEFFGSFCTKPPNTLAKLMKWVDKYIRQDDALTTSRFVGESRDRGKVVEDRWPKRQERRQNRGPEITDNRGKGKSGGHISPRSLRQGAGLVNDDSNGTINMIVGRTGGQMSKRVKKRNRSKEGSISEVMQIVEHSPVTISFSLEDAHGVQMPHDDALVIEAIIHNF